MSQISLSPAATGTANFTIEAPATNTNRTVTLPDSSGQVSVLDLRTAVTASGTAVDFLNIPATARRVTVMFNGVSTNGTSNPLIQLGDSGGFETTGYVSAAGSSDGSGASTSTAGFVFRSSLAANAISGVMTINLLNGNLWTSVHNTTFANIASWGAGSKTLSDTLDRIRITTVNGTDTFDAGSINIMVE
jgi:hypothetical protein